MAFVDGGLTTSKRIMKDLANIFTSACSKLTPQITNEQRVVDDLGTINLNYVPLSGSSFIFKTMDENGGYVVMDPTPDYTRDGRQILFTSNTYNGETLYVSYNGDRDWKLIYPMKRDEDDDQNALLTEEAKRLDQLSRIGKDEVERFIVKTTTTPVDIDVIENEFSTDPNDSQTQLTMYVEFRKPTIAINPEDSSGSYIDEYGLMTSIENNHYVLVRTFDEYSFDEETCLFYPDASKSTDPTARVLNRSEWSKYSWFMDFREDIKSYTPLGSTPSLEELGLKNTMTYLRPIKLTNKVNVVIRYWISVNNDRINMVLMGSPDLDPRNYLISWAYIGKMKTFINNVTGKPYYNDCNGNFAITCGSSTIPCKQLVEVSEGVSYNGLYPDADIKIIPSGSVFITQSIDSINVNGKWMIWLAGKVLDDDASNVMFFKKGGTASSPSVPEGTYTISTDADKGISFIEFNSAEATSKYSIGFYATKSEGELPDSTSLLNISKNAKIDWGSDTPQKMAAGSAYNKVLIYAYKVSFITNQIETNPIYITYKTYANFWLKFVDKNGDVTGAPMKVTSSNMINEAFSNKNSVQFVNSIKVHVTLPTMNNYIEDVKLYRSYMVGKWTSIDIPIAPISEAVANGKDGIYSSVPLGYPCESYEIENEFSKYYDTNISANILTDVDNTKYCEFVETGLASNSTILFATLPSVTYKFIASAPIGEVRLDIEMDDEGNKQYGVIRDTNTKEIVHIFYPDVYAENTATGVDDIAVYKNRDGMQFQKHIPAFIAFDEYEEKIKFNPSRWTDSIHMSKIYVCHKGDGFRGELLDVAICDKQGIFNGDILTVNKGSVDPNNPEERYKFFAINSPYNFMNSSPSNCNGIAIKME